MKIAQSRLCSMMAQNALLLVRFIPVVPVVAPDLHIPAIQDDAWQDGHAMGRQVGSYRLPARIV